MPAVTSPSNSSSGLPDEHSVRTHHDDAAPRAHAFFWRVLIVAATLSITGNAAHAILHNPNHAAISAAVAVVPPVALLAAVHGVSVLLQAHTDARLTHLLATGMTLLIAAGAFRLSFSALSELALFAGVPSNEAWLLPLIIEGSMTQATIALLALAHTTSRAHGQPPLPNHTDRRLPSPTRGATTDTETTATPNSPDAVHTLAAHHEHEGRWTALATTICNQDPARRRNLTEVATILTYHHDHGWNPTRIAKEINRSRSTVSRVISLSAQLSPQ